MQKRRGLTLMEMVFVLMLMAILGGVMTFYYMDALISADANNILNTMQYIRTATLMWYSNNSSRVRLDNNGNVTITTKGTQQSFRDFIKEHGSDEIIKKYISKNNITLRCQGEGTNNTGDYAIIAAALSQKVNNKTTYTSKWYVCYNGGTDSWTISNYGNESPYLKIKKKLAGRAKQYNLIATTADVTKNTDITNPQSFVSFTDQKFICMPILELAVN